MANNQLLDLAHEINQHKRKDSFDVSNHTVIAIAKAEDESNRLLKGETRESMIENSEEKLILDNMNRKRALIYEELEKITNFMQIYKRQAKKLSFWDNVTKSIVTACSAVASLILFVGIEQRKDGSQTDPALYFGATVCTSISTILGQLTNSWNLSEKSHTNNTTYKSLHNLHDFISYQILRNHVTSLQLDALLSDMSTRLILIRDAAESGSGV